MLSLLSCFVLLPLLVTGQATLNGTISFNYLTDAGAVWIAEGDGPSADMVSGIEEGLKSLVGGSSLNVFIGNATIVQNLTVEMRILISGSNFTTTDAKACRLGVDLVIVETLRAANEAITNTISGSMGTVTGFAWDPDTSNTAVQNAQSASMTGAFQLVGISVPYSQLLADLQDPAKKADMILHVLLALGKALGLGTTAAEIKKRITCDIQAVVAGSGRRLLSSSDAEASYTVSGLSAGQAEAYGATASGDNFGTTMQSNMANEVTNAYNDFASINISNPEAYIEGGSTDMYVPNVYTPIDSVKFMNNVPRLAGSNVLPLDFTSFDNLIPYVIGIAITGTFFFLGFFFSLFAPCCQCCCCKACCGPKNGDKVPVSSTTIFLNGFVAVLVGVMAVGGVSAAMDGETALGAAVGNVQQSLVDTSATLRNFTATLSSLETNMNTLSATLDTYSSCSIMTELKGASTQSDLLSSLNIGNGMDETIKSIGNNLALYNGYRADASKGIGAFLFLAMCWFSFIVLALLFMTHLVSKCTKAYQISSTIVSVIALFLLPFVWLLASISEIFSVVLADLCITDPVVTLSNVLASMIPGEIGSMLKFFLTCDGELPAMLLDIYRIAADMQASLVNLDGLSVIFTKSAGCSTVDNTRITAEMTLVVNDLLGILDLARCKTFNPILQNTLHDGLCKNFQYGIYLSWIGLFLIAFFLHTALFNYIKVIRYNDVHASDKVYPKGSTSDVEMGKKY